MRAWSARAMPGPVSRTAILTSPFSFAVVPPTRRRELDRVGKQVEDDLPDTTLVAFHQVDGGVELELQLDAVLRRALPDHDDPALQRLAEGEHPAFELHLPCLHLGQVEDVVDQREQ